MMLENLQAIDQKITLAINSLHSHYGDYLWQFLSLKESWYPLYAVVVFFVIKRLGWKRGLIMTLSMVLTIVACDQFANLVKDSVARLRPCYNSKMLEEGLHVLEERASFYGFFSAHAANAFGFAISSYLSFRTDENHPYVQYRWFIYSWAVLIALSRIFSGKHYFGDVMVGMAVGLAFGYLFSYGAKILTKKLRLSPS